MTSQMKGTMTPTTRTALMIMMAMAMSNIGNEVGNADLNTISDDDKENESDLKATNDVEKEEDGTFLPHHLLQICHNWSDYVR